MAKTSMVEREKKRIKLSKKLFAKRKALKDILKSLNHRTSHLANLVGVIRIELMTSTMST
jgi:hypothetical protein